MSFFDAFYFMSYTATTIGFGEMPATFTSAQRMWVTVTIYLTVIGWAYAIGSMLTLLQDRSFRQAVALQRFTRKVRPAAGAVPADGRVRPDRGAAGPGLRRARPAVRGDGRLGDRIDALELDPTTPICPDWSATPRNPRTSGSPGWTIPSAPACWR